MLFTSVKVKIFSVTTLLWQKWQTMIMLGRNKKTILSYKCIVKAALLRKGACNKESRLELYQCSVEKATVKTILVV